MILAIPAGHDVRQLLNNSNLDKTFRGFSTIDKALSSLELGSISTMLNYPPNQYVTAAQKVHKYYLRMAATIADQILTKAIDIENSESPTTQELIQSQGQNLAEAYQVYWHLMQLGPPCKTYYRAKEPSVGELSLERQLNDWFEKNPLSSPSLIVRIEDGRFLIIYSGEQR